jgi:hypothetical protein
MKNAAQWMADPQLYTTSALILCADAFGSEFIEWDPLTLNLEIKNKYGFEPSENLLDMVQAGTSLYTSDLFFKSLETFAPVCNALNFGTVTSELFLPPDLDDVLWGCTEAKIILGETYEEDGFSHNIARFVGALLDDQGNYSPPRILKFAEYPDERDALSHDAFIGDEVGYGAWQNAQEEEKDMLEKWNMRKIRALMVQMKQLPIKTGSTDFIDNVLKALETA